MIESEKIKQENIAKHSLNMNKTTLKQLEFRVRLQETTTKSELKCEAAKYQELRNKKSSAIPMMMDQSGWDKTSNGNGYDDDDGDNCKSFQLPTFKSASEKQHKIFGQTKICSERKVDATQDHVSLPKLEEKFVRKDIKRRATPFQISKKYEIRKWLNDTMLHIEEEQHKIQNEDCRMQPRERSLAFDSRMLTRRGSINSIVTSSDHGRDGDEWKAYKTEMKQGLPSLRKGVKEIHGLHKNKSDSNIKVYMPQTYDFKQKRHSLSAESGISGARFKV